MGITRVVVPTILLIFAEVIPSISGYIASQPQQYQRQELSNVVPKVPPNESRLSGEESIASSLFSSIQHVQISSTRQVTKVDDTTVPVDAVLSPLEAWCLSRLDQWYAKSQSFKCPFMRRRSGDILDTLESVMKHTMIRKECWPIMGPPQAHRPAGTNKKTNAIKYKGLSLSELHQNVLQDWKPDTDGKGYYITGKLTTPIFRDDCLFLGPDPDMPIHGLRKYVGVASHLFDYDTSRATLHSLEMKEDKNALVAKWTMSGILRLPWRPALPTFSGTTTYHIDDEGLIYCHEETWDCSAMRAFCHTLLPDIANAIWKSDDSQDERRKTDRE